MITHIQKHILKCVARCQTLSADGITRQTEFWTGRLYPSLYHLEREGYVESRWSKESKCRVYSATDKGHAWVKAEGNSK